MDQQLGVIAGNGGGGGGINDGDFGNNENSILMTSLNQNNYHIQMSASSMDISQLLQQIMYINTQPLSLKEEGNYDLDGHKMKPALYQVLMEIKEKTSLNVRPSIDDEAQDPEQVRLDNFLMAEGIIGPKGTGVSGDSMPLSPSSQQNQAWAGEADPAPGDNTEYKQKLKMIRKFFNDETRFYEERRDGFMMSTIQLLKNQAQVRPISDREINRMAIIVRKKFNSIQNQLKQSTCEIIMTLRNRFLDARRKRRNFSKPAKEILEDYFHKHLANPYPSEEAKEELARKCGISVSQVSNWFGNKRIRYKKNIGKAQKEAKNAAAFNDTAASPMNSTYSE